MGVEHVSLEALKELGVPKTLEDAGFSGPQRAAALGNIIGRMCVPRSERATAQWLKEGSALGELLNYDFNSMPLMQLYRASDKLLKHLHGGRRLNKPRCTKKRNTINERIGRLKEKCKRVSAHYRIEMTVDESKDHVTSLSWYYELIPSSKQTDPGVYKLRTTLTD